MGQLWNRGYARASMMRGEKTSNPTPAAASLLGKRRVARAKRIHKRRRFHKHNPAPALIASLLPGLGSLGKKLQSRDARDKARFAQADALGARAALGDAAALAELTRVSQHFATRAAKDYALGILAQVQAGMRTPAAAPAATLAQVLASPVAAGVIRTVTSTATRRRSTRQRYPTYRDRQGRQRYSYKAPGSELRIPAGATPTPGTPYNFFRGAVGAGGAAATVGQVAVAGAAGIAAYLVTQRLLQYLGGRAQAKEEAGVNAALAFRQARADFTAQQGRAMTAAETREMGDAYKAKLVELGYDPETFTRTRSGLDNFLETYNPFGG